MLRDLEIETIYTAIVGAPVPTDVDGPKSPIQPASVDLHVGRIYVPETKPDELGGVNQPRTELSLATGETAVVETKEEISLPPNIGAIGFTPSSLSARGLLTTNPGHIDPGYKGKLTFTVINMGRTPISLETGDVVMTLVVFTLTGDARAPYDKRNPSSSGATVTATRMDSLAKDMLDVSGRIKRAVEDGDRQKVELVTQEEGKTRRTATVVGVVSPVVALILSLTIAIVGYLSTTNENADKLDTIDDRVVTLESQGDLARLDERLTELEEVDALQERIEALEEQVEDLQPASTQPGG